MSEANLKASKGAAPAAEPTWHALRVEEALTALASSAASTYLHKSANLKPRRFW